MFLPICGCRARPGTRGTSAPSRAKLNSGQIRRIINYSRGMENRAENQTCPPGLPGDASAASRRSQPVAPAKGSLHNNSDALLQHSNASDQNSCLGVIDKIIGIKRSDSLDQFLRLNCFRNLELRHSGRLQTLCFCRNTNVVCSSVRPHYLQCLIILAAIFVRDKITGLWHSLHTLSHTLRERGGDEDGWSGERSAELSEHWGFIHQTIRD